MRSKPCPCCGYTEESLRPTVSLDTNSIAFRGKIKKLAPRQAEVAASLVRDFGQVVHHEMLKARVLGRIRYDRADADALMKAHIHMLRQKLVPLGLKIDTQYGVGFAMSRT